MRHADGTVEDLDPGRLDEIDQLTATEGTLVWVSAVSPDDTGVEVLRREFNLHPLAVEDVREQEQRPGIYGMNFDRMPELALPYGYPLALGLMVLAVIVPVTFFRRRGWF